MALTIYLTFNGNCREAFEFYRAALGGDFQTFQTFADGPEDMQVADDVKDTVMHVSLPIGDSVLMGSDTGSTRSPVSIGNNFSISIEGENREHCDELFAKLSAGGTVTMPMQETFWGSYYGMLTDKFDIQWMVDCELQTD